MKMKQLSCALLLCLGLTGCQAVTDTLSTVNSALGSVNSALSGVTRSTVSNETQISSDNAVKNAKAENSVKILRIEKIKKLAANTVSFQTVYMSPQSEEVVRKTHFAVKQPSGEWLFNFWGI